jgi:hypothetical protein
MHGQQSSKCNRTNSFCMLTLRQQGSRLVPRFRDNRARSTEERQSSPRQRFQVAHMSFGMAFVASLWLAVVTKRHWGGSKAILSIVICSSATETGHWLAARSRAAASAKATPEPRVGTRAGGRYVALRWESELQRPDTTPTIWYSQHVHSSSGGYQVSCRRRHHNARRTKHFFVA